MEIKKQLKEIGLFSLYILIVLSTLFGAIAEEIPYVQLEDPSGLLYLNIFTYNTSVHNNLTGLQGGQAPNEYYHLNYAEYLLVTSILSNISFDLDMLDLQEGYIYVGNSSNNPEGVLPEQILSDYSTTAEIIAFGYYNASDFVITDYFTKTDITGFGYYNESDFVIADYLTSAQIFAYNYYNSSDFDISDYVTSAILAGYNYYNASDFSISDYYTKTQVDAIIIGIGNFSDWDKAYEDLINTPTVLSNFTDDILWTSDFNNTFDSRDKDTNLTESDIAGFGFTKDADTNASTACSGAELLYGNGSCAEAPALIVIYYNASSIQVITGTGAGTLADIQTYNQISYNVTEASSDYELRVNFTGITEFTTLLIRHKTDVDAGHISAIQIWDYNTSTWEGYGYLTESITSEIKTLGVYDDDEHIDGGIVQVRFYQVELGNAGHIHQFDWVAISKGFGTPVGREIDPLSIHRDGNVPLTDSWDASQNITVPYILGNGSQLVGVLKTEIDPIFNAWDNFTGIPHATPSNNDVTHFSFADEIYDWVIGLNYITNAVSNLINYYLKSEVYNKTEVYNKAETDSLYAPTGYGDDFNKTYTDTLYTNETDTDTNLTEDNVEAYIFDNDNTGNLNMSSYNITMGDVTIYTNTTCFVIEVGTTYLEVCE